MKNREKNILKNFEELDNFNDDRKQQNIQNQETLNFADTFITEKQIQQTFGRSINKKWIL